MAWLNSTGPRFSRLACWAVPPFELGGPAAGVGVCAFRGAGAWLMGVPFWAAGTALCWIGLAPSNGAPWLDPGKPDWPFCTGALNVASGLSAPCDSGGCQPGLVFRNACAGPPVVVSCWVARPPPIEWIVEPEGVVTRMLLGLFSRPHSIRYPGGRKVLKPWIRFGWPAKSSETLLMTPGVSILPRVSTPVRDSLGSLHPRLALEVLHDIEESVIDIWLLMKLDLDLVEVAQCILTNNEGQLQQPPEVPRLVCQRAPTLSIGCCP